jgi:hypothetical protein
MGSLLNFVSEKGKIGNGHGIFVKEEPTVSFMHNAFTDLLRLGNQDEEVIIDNNLTKIKLNQLISTTFNYELKDDSKNILVYEVWDFNWLLNNNNFLLNYILDGLTTQCIDYLNKNKLKIIISNIGEASLVDETFFIKFEKIINDRGLTSNNFIFIDGNFNLNEIKSNFKIYTPNHFLSIVPDFIGKNQLNYESSVPTIEESKSITKRKKHFLSFNRAQRVHRGILLTHILKNNLFDKFYISALKPFEQPVHYGSEKLKDYRKYIEKVNDLVPIEIDTHDYHEAMMDFWPGNCFKKNLFLDSYFHICTETFFFQDGVTFFTEKILKPIIGLQPFIVLGSYNYLKNLRKLGFKTFGDIFDESYDDIKDPFDRIISILNLIDEISSWDLEKCEEKYKSVLDICIYNYNHLYTNIKDDNEIFKMIKNIHDEW